MLYLNLIFESESSSFFSFFFVNSRINNWKNDFVGEFK